MKYQFRTCAAVPQRVLIVEIPAHEPDLGPPSQLCGERRTPHQRRDGITPRAKRLDQVSTDEAGASGHKDVHSGLS